jgi:hypothetical protein
MQAARHPDDRRDDHDDQCCRDERAARRTTRGAVERIAWQLVGIDEVVEAGHADGLQQLRGWSLQLTAG